MRSIIVKVTKAGKEYNGKTIFENVNLEIREGEHIALFGVNGVGKTTLIQALLGKQELDAGTIVRHLPVSAWGTLDQHVEAEDSITMLGFVQSGLSDWLAAKNNLERIQNQMQEAEEPSAEAGRDKSGNAGEKELRLSVLLEQYDQAHAAYETLGGYETEIKVEKCLQRLKLPESLWNIPFNQLSGGQKTKVQLARILIAEPRFLLLDEPTNHLDEETLEWLEEWVASYSGTILLVSHDRVFLDRTAHAIYELTADGCRRYEGGYTSFRKQKDLEMQTQMAIYRKQEQEKEKLLECIRRYQQWFQTAEREAGNQSEVGITKSYYKARANKNITRYHAKEKELERLENNRVQIPKENAKIHVNFGQGEFAPNYLLRVEQMAFKYEGEGSKTLFDDFNLRVERKDRIAVIGPNGTGKTTLLRIIMGELVPLSGSIQHNPQLRIGYFSQQMDNLQEDATILDSLLELPNMTQTFARTILGCFLFSREDVFKYIRDLSMGERCRVAFLQLYFSEANLLVLDEPTNYLDIDTRERMEQAFEQYPGALIVVSHDRYLTQRLATRLVVLHGERTELYAGTYDQYKESGRLRGQTMEQRGKRDELQLLELELMKLINRKPENPEEEAKLIEDMRDVKKRMAVLEQAR